MDQAGAGSVSLRRRDLRRERLSLNDSRREALHSPVTTEYPRRPCHQHCSHADTPRCVRK